MVKLILLLQISHVFYLLIKMFLHPNSIHWQHQMLCTRRTAYELVASTKRFVNIASANQNCCGDDSTC